jgi:predicted ATPase
LQLLIEEEGGRLIPAARLSDGTLRYLCLLAILLHPNPPSVIGIEEPELGLHPDIMPTIAELLKQASERTQLFVTTHSDALVSALSDTPESILVCEGTPDGTTMKRLNAEHLREWLDKYSLGEIWRMGEIGGNRW